MIIDEKRRKKSHNPANFPLPSFHRSCLSARKISLLWTASREKEGGIIFSAAIKGGIYFSQLVPPTPLPSVSFRIGVQIFALLF